MGRVATLAEIGASIAHELRQPLTAIRANADAGLLLLARRRSDLREALDSFRAIAADCDRAAEVIDDVRQRGHVFAENTSDGGALVRVTLPPASAPVVAGRRGTGLRTGLRPSVKLVSPA